MKNRALWTSTVIFVVNRYKCITETNNFSEHSAAINLPKKKPHQSFTGCYKKLGGSGLTPRHKEYQK